jgi:GNAT superfamily N-acetyltransferase
MNNSHAEKSEKQGVSIRQLDETDLGTADHIFRVAFGTFMGAPEPENFFGDTDYVKTRWRANPEAAFAAVSGDEVIGSNFAGDWGSVGFFGPLTVRPDFWDKGVATRLMEPVMAMFDRWGIKHAGLFTFAQSPKHVGLYQKFGFFPRFLTAIMSKQVDPAKQVAGWTMFSEGSETDRKKVISSCADLTDKIFDGLDLEMEIRAVANQNLGETVLLYDNSGLSGFAVCHAGAGTEAGSGTCYIKFAAARPGPGAAKNFGRLVEACEQMAAAKNLSRIVAGVNTARSAAYRMQLAAGFRTDFQGVAMERPNEAGYNRPDIFAIDDWR